MCVTTMTYLGSHASKYISYCTCWLCCLSKKFAKKDPKKRQNCSGKEIISAHELQLGCRAQCNYHSSTS